MIAIQKTGKGRSWLWLLAVYLLMLALSHLVRRNTPAAAPLAGGKKLIRVKAVAGEAQTALDVQLAYREFSPAAKDSLSVLILLHGSPMGSESFDDLGPALGQSYRVIVPDLPGFGASSAQIPDYSIRAHAKYMLQLMDRLQIDKAHVVAYSMGGGVAINMAAIAPQRISSLIMLSAIGVQELELLGDYHLNRAVHGAQLGLLWLLQETFPHFGLMDRSMLNTRYARNFYDSDQRPLRNDLLNYRGPMLILHGQSDELVPYAVAAEHYRIVPQSELKTYPTGHGLAFMRWQWIAPDIAHFVDAVETGKAATRSTADSARVAASTLPFDPKSSPMASGIGLIVLMLLIATATLVSEDLACIGTGLMIAHGAIGFLPGTLACLWGIYFGDLLLFWAGRLFGRPAVAHAPLKWFVSEDSIRRSTEWFNRQGKKIILLSRFVPGSRLPTYFTAGVLRTNFWSFSLYFLLAAFIWTPLLVGVSMFIGEEAARRARRGGPHRSVGVDGGLQKLRCHRRLGYACRDLCVFQARHSAVQLQRAAVAALIVPPFDALGILAAVGFLHSHRHLHYLPRPQTSLLDAVHRRQSGDSGERLYRRIEIGNFAGLVAREWICRALHCDQKRFAKRRAAATSPRIHGRE